MVYDDEKVVGVIVGLTSGTRGSAPVSCSRLRLITTGVLVAFNTGAEPNPYHHRQHCHQHFPRTIEDPLFPLWNKFIVKVLI